MLKTGRSSAKWSANRYFDHMNLIKLGRSAIIATLLLLLLGVSGVARVSPARAASGGLGVSFSYSPSSPVVYQVITFSTGCYGAPPCEFSWDFGDGTHAGNVLMVQHSYSTLGQYSVMLSGSDSNGNFGSQTKTVMVSVCSSSTGFTYTPSNPFATQSITFSSTTSVQTCALSWTFGDGTVDSSNKMTIQHAFAVGGSYTVSLHNVDSNGNIVPSTSQVVKVAAPSHRPSNQYFDFRTALNGPVTGSNTYLGSDAAMGISVEQYDYTQGAGPNGWDVYHLRIMAAANTRVDHSYIVDNSVTFTGYDNCGAYSTCVASGLTAGNQGKWFSFGGLIYYFWGHPYSRIFVCSNGWAAFNYTGDPNNCPSLPETFPTNDNPTSLPTAIIAPFWEPLDPTSTTGSGTISFDLHPPLVSNRHVAGAGAGFGVTWSGVMVSGTQTCVAPCTEHPVQNSFSFSFDDIGDISFGYGSIDTKDPYYNTATMGVEDPSGFYALNVPRSDALTYGGEQMRDPNIDVKDVFPYGHIVDTKIILTDLTASDGAIGGWDTAYLNTANMRIGQPTPRNYDLSEYGNVAAGIIVGLLCTGSVGLGCIFVPIGVAIGGEVLLKGLEQQPAPVSPPSNMNGASAGALEILAHQDDGLCGVALYASDVNWHDCAEDVAVFEQIDWVVPHDSSVHAITVQFSVQLGAAACCPSSSNPWRSTSVNFSVDARDFTISANPSALSVPFGSTGSSIVGVSPVNGLTDTVTLSPNYPGLSCNLNPTTIAGSGTATLSCSGLATGTYPATVTGTAGRYNELTRSTTITFTIQDFRLTANPISFSACQGGTGSTQLVITSQAGWAGTVALTTSPPPGITATTSPTQVSVASGTSSYANLYVYPSSTTATGNYIVRVIGSSGSLSNPLDLTVTVTSCSTGGGGGSVADGTLITMADRSTVPVQNLKVGDQMLGYDTATGKFTISTVTSITTVVTHNMLVINTASGQPFRVDANPKQTLWVKTIDGQIGWMPVTLIKVGDCLFTQNGWTPVTSIEYAPLGNHIMYDIISTAPYFASGYLDPIRKT